VNEDAIDLWWIMQMIWDDERAGVELPAELFAVANG